MLASLCFVSSTEVLFKRSLLQARWAGVPNDRWRRCSQSSLDAVWYLAHLCGEAGSYLLNVRTPLLWKESPDQVGEASCKHANSSLFSENCRI